MGYEIWLMHPGQNEMTLETPQRSFARAIPLTPFARDVVRSVFWFGVLPNLLFVILGHFVYLMRPVVNVDYLLVGIVAAFVPRLWAILFFGLVFGNDILVNGAPIYHFQIVDLFLWARDVFLINWRYSLPVGIGLVGFGSIVSVITVRFGAKFAYPKKTAAVLFGLCFLISSADILNGTSFILLPIHQSFANFNIAYSGGRRSLLSLATLLEQGNISTEPLTPAQSAAGALFAQAKGAQAVPQTQIALIVVESMGVFKDGAAEALLTGPLTSPELAKRYEITTTTVPFHGHTIDGEFRELCGARLRRGKLSEMPSELSRRKRF
jgi:hypothetical protein